MADTSQRGLTGFRVVELGEMVSAPYATKLLADLGAEVIKIEPPDGDRARRRGPYRNGFHQEQSGLFLALNTNKRTLVVDPADPASLARLDNVIAEADLLVTNWAPTTLASYGVDLEVLHQQRPELVACSMLAFGLSGPHAHFSSEELTASHAGGWAYQCPGASSEVDQPPLKVFGHQSDFHAGLVAATVTMAALHGVANNGVGDLIDLSTIAHTAGMLEAALIAASYMGENPGRLGSRLLNPWRIFECADGLMFLVTVEQDQWERLVALMGAPDWATGGLFDTVELRLENEDLLTLYLSEWMAEQRVGDLWHEGQEQRVCFAPVLTMADLAKQEHLAARGFFVEVDHPVAGTVTHLGPPFLASNGMWGPLQPAPLLDPDARPSFTERAKHRPQGSKGPATSQPNSAARRGPLDGVRVLDLSWVWAGPYATLHLAYLGAEVVKVESAARPGLGRRLALHPPDVEPSLNTSAYFNQWDQGKLSCAVDMSTDEGIDLVRALIAESDVVVENFATGVMDRLGLGYDELRRARSDIIVASISGYGSEGPLRHFMGYGPTTGPLSGLTSLTGYVDGPPRELGISVGDPAAGITAALAIVAALHHRTRTGEGCYIDVALWEATTSCAVEGWMHHQFGGSPLPRMGNRDPLMAPHNCYRTRPSSAPPSSGELDPGQWVSIACADDAAWRALAEQIDPLLVDDPRFTTATQRKANEDALDELIAGWAASRDRWEITESLQARGVAAFPSMSPQDLLSWSHLWDRGFFEQLQHAEVGCRTHAGVPWLSRSESAGVAAPAPLLGQHTDLVLHDVLGLNAAQIADLRHRGVCD